MKRTPRLQVEIDSVGVSRVVVHVDADAPADAGFELLRAALPALRDLDRRVGKARS